MDHELPKLVRTKEGSPLPRVIRTTGEAIDAIQALSNDVRSKPPWRNAQRLLFAGEKSDTLSDLKAAHQALEQALSAERWLHT